MTAVAESRKRYVNVRVIDVRFKATFLRGEGKVIHVYAERRENGPLWPLMGDWQGVWKGRIYASELGADKELWEQFTVEGEAPICENFWRIFCDDCRCWTIQSSKFANISLLLYAIDTTEYASNVFPISWTLIFIYYQHGFNASKTQLSCAEQYLPGSLRLLLRHCSSHSNIKFILAAV